MLSQKGRTEGHALEEYSLSDMEAFVLKKAHTARSARRAVRAANSRTCEPPLEPDATISKFITRKDKLTSFYILRLWRGFMNDSRARTTRELLSTSA